VVLVPVAVSLFIQAGSGRGLAQPLLEHKVKAAFLLNFTRYVSWPTGAFDDDVTPIEICVLGRDPFGSLLDRTVAGRSSQGRPVRVRRPANAREAGACHEVFISAAESERQPDLLATLRDKPILTVGETDEFLEQGGLVRLVVVDNAVRFEINATAAARSDLRIGARLLGLARRVMGP